MTFTKAIFAASLVAVVMAAPAAQPGNEENKVPGGPYLNELLAKALSKEPPDSYGERLNRAHRRNHIPLGLSADLKLRTEHLQHAHCRSLVLISAPQHDARAFQTSARTRLLADECKRGDKRSAPRCLASWRD
ncbi:hypothetical protein EDB86DRAFT_3076770 [Lactarius hatsudake]|nr:hypothetical protein EDB86DRAFT_3076770 [Lactarius hatsudake]